MKNFISLMILTLLFACNTVPEPKPVDLAAEEVAIKDVFKSLFQSIDDRNIEQLASPFADGGIFMGNDPDELYPKDSIVKGWTQLMQMPDIPPFEFIGEPFIRIHSDGKTAIYSSQYYWKLFTTLPLRQTFWLVKKDSEWVIEFFDFSVIPYNEQYPLLNEAIAKSQE